MVTRTYTPDRGDIVWVSLDPQAGHEQKGRRPALVLSPKNYNEKSFLALVCPITSQIKGYPFEVPIDDIKNPSVVLADQVKSIDWRARRVERIATTSSDVVRRTQQLIAAIVGI